VSGPRTTVARRLLLILCGIAASSTALALLLQERALKADLEQAAGLRLERAASGADRLIESHLRTLSERYAAISKAPEFRANLEVKHGPTLAFHAEQLARQQRAALLLFADRNGRIRALAGERGLQAPAEEALGASDRALLARDGALFAAARVPLTTRGRLVGRLLAVEAVGEESLAGWSELCGARVAALPARERGEAALDRVVRRLGELELRVIASLDEERRALANARRNQLTAGAVALALAFVASGLLAQGLVRPIREIQHATERIARGDLSTRLRLRRRDEIGDVGRGFDLMLDRLEHAMDRLRESESRLAGAQRRARLGSFTLELESGRLLGSAELRRVLEVGEEVALDRALLLARVHPEDRARFEAALEACARDGSPFELDHRSACDRGAERILHAQGERVAGADGVQRVEGTVQDVTDRKLVEEQIRYLAYHDSVTGLGNRRLFKERLALAVDEARRSGSALAVLFLDLDGFKVINDTLGHSAGDRLLRGVADRLVTTLRASADASAAGAPRPAQHLVARLGGDEFTILLAAIRGPQDAGRVARRVLRALAEPFPLDGHEVSVRGSIGIATSPADGEDVETLLRNCDTAMYHAKEQGRNNYQFFAEAMNAVVFKRLVLENRLRRAIERDELELHYQPKLAVETGRIAGVEALARWRDPELGIVSPSVFIPLAEDAGLIRAIGDWALRTALRQLAEWDAAGVPALRVSVNLSGQQLGSPSLLARVVDALGAARVDPQRLQLEITETALLQDEAAAMPVLEELRRMGVGIALDDFGIGYSSLSHLLRIPADALKIDRSFLQRIDTEPADAALVGAIISMAKIRGLRVVAEGVESEEQLAVLRELGCDEIQGHLFGAAVPASELPSLVREIEVEAPKRDLGAAREPDAGREPRRPGPRMLRRRARPASRRASRIETD
jgi:diguanylate cyclase (GGDEF)-like protein